MFILEMNINFLIKIFSQVKSWYMYLKNQAIHLDSYSATTTTKNHFFGVNHFDSQVNVSIWSN